MTDPQRRAVQDRAMDAITESRRVTRGIDRHVPVNTPAGDAAVILAAIRAADLVILDRETVKLAVRWGEFVEDYGSDTAWTMTYDAPALKQMEEALRDG